MNPYTNSIKKHAKKRARERFDIKLSKNQRAKLIADIKRRRYQFVRTSHKDRIVLRVRDIGEHEFDVVFDPRHNELVTFLYPEPLPPRIKKT